jgi:hypothetical protein
VVLQFNTEETVINEGEVGSLREIWQRESARKIADGAKQGSVLTAEADRKLNVIRGLQGFRL